MVFLLSFIVVNAKSIDSSINNLSIEDESRTAEIDTPSFVSNNIDADTLFEDKDSYFTSFLYWECYINEKMFIFNNKFNLFGTING